jgi:hypothetical protein
LGLHGWFYQNNFAGFQTGARVTGVKTRIIKQLKHGACLSQCLMALFLVVANEVIAADKAEPGNVSPKQAAEPDASAAWQRRIPEMVSDNLPLGEIIKELRRRFPEINFLIKQQTETDIDVAATTINMSVRAVTLQEFLKALEIAAQRPIQITGGPDERLVVFESKAAAVAVDAAGLPLRPVIQTRVFNIGSYLARAGKEEKEALVELEEVLKLTGALFTEANPTARPFKPKLQIHRGTKLLIAVGSVEELNVIQQVVNSLENTPIQAKAPASSERGAKAGTAAEPPAGNKR